MSYIVYKHTSPNNKVYIGITSTKPNRRWGFGSGYKSNNHFYNAIQKYGWENFKHEILFDNLTKKEAYDLETKMIRYYKSNDKRYGYNKTQGGELGSSKPVTQYDLDGNIIKQYESAIEASLELNITSDSITFCAQGHVKTAWGYVWRYNGDTFDKYHTEYLNRLPWINIYKYDFSGNLIRIYTSKEDLLGDYKKTQLQDIRNCCNGKYKQILGYVWRYENEPFEKYLKDENGNIVTLNQRHNKSYYENIKIYQYDINGNLIKVHENIYAIDFITNSKQRNIVIECANLKRKTAYKYIWRFERDYFLEEKGMEKRQIISNRKPVVQYSINGEYIKHWDSVREAEEKTLVDNISLCLVGKRKTAGGFVWRYENDPFDKYVVEKAKSIKSRKYDNMPVYCYNLDLTLYKEYNDVYETKNDGFIVGNVTKCLLKQIKTVKGMIFSFEKLDN